MPRARIHIQDLPFDILAIFFTFLDPWDFLSFCSTCSDFYEHNSDLDFWRSVTQDEFRLPNRPSAEYDGNRWKSLYRRLRRETHIYLWGQQRRTRNLLSGDANRDHLNIFPYPLSEYPISNGVIVDMQIGGWSTTVLDSNGDLFTSGPLHGDRGSAESGTDRFCRLKFSDSSPTASGTSSPDPAPIPVPRLRRAPINPRAIMGGPLILGELPLSSGIPSNPGPFPGQGAASSSVINDVNTTVEDSATAQTTSSKAIQTFSAGRSHVLALDDNGTPWLWYRASHPAIKVQFPDVGEAMVDWVCAGFNHTSAYVRHWGIVVWEYASKYHQIHADPQPWNIPTSSDWSILVPQSAGDENIGKVTKHILLEKYVLFASDKGKLFCSSIENPLTFQVPDFDDVIDIQGAFRTFGIFKKGGAVIVALQAFLGICEQQARNPLSQDEIIPPVPIPALQNTGVVQLAFGDYHFHALHSDGRITSYGKEPSTSGALGLSGIKSRTAIKVRGVRSRLNDAVLLPHGYFTGRHVWFSVAKHKWLSALTAAFDRSPIDDESKLGEFSEWVEQRGSNWDDIPEVGKLNEDGLGSHFALSIAAGGWSSGALLLVNEEMDKIVEKHCQPPPLEKLPNIAISDGSHLVPGEQEFPWKKEPPLFNIKPGNGSIWGIDGWVFTDDETEANRHGS